ncbi:peptidyl-prolyl cis-trans isomerase-like 4 [Ischnura elegans]|uniref:peptidyl-prolyl cis-trans isomerase-like 4 n=1 Tax=Ischnura elegans TaxID=197161 RepID=UPI001ED8ABC0|nr:peptidyl-prolyl cis-trans isomerase-like 4 [Ischnura elegans]
MAVVIETTMGCLTVDLFVEERPITCTNFLKLCKMKYYNFCLFHSVQNNFIAQTGDPTGTGNGGESIFSLVHGEEAKYYEAEVMPKIKHSRAGLVSMVNCGNNMLGSQFFFTLGDELHSLDGEHCVFGEVTEGLDVLIQLKEVICDEAHHPFRDIRITHTIILEDPFDDPPNLTFPDRSPEPTKERLTNGRIAPDEEVDDTKGKTIEEVEEMVQKREAQARATILEIVGDIPDADVAPPENILFVCKLNPVTTDEDLEIIFGRFGVVKSCEVIRDKTTGDSLQYAFIEFEDKKACENAYFKMDNVLIDDRRIHVDFSQSVAKMRWRGKGKGVDYFPDNKQKELSKRDYKEQVDKYNSRIRRNNRSRSRSPASQRWRSREERTPETWEKYGDKSRTKNREEFERRHEKNWDTYEGKNKDKYDRYNAERRKKYYGQGVYDHSRDESNFNWEKRHGSREVREYFGHGRSGPSERNVESPDVMKERERRNYDRSRLKAKEPNVEERKRGLKESFSSGDKYFEDREEHSGRNERGSKEEKDGRVGYGESSRNDERKHGDRRHKQRREEYFHGNDVDAYRNDFEMSSENENRGSKRKRSEDRERSTNLDGVKRKSGHSNHHMKGNVKSSDGLSGSRGKDTFSKEKIHEYKDAFGDVEGNGSMKYDDGHTSRRGRSDSSTKKSVDKKTSKLSVSDGKKHQWSSTKVKKVHGVKGKKLQRRSRYSSSSCCCSDSSCSCDSSCYSSSSDSDDSDLDSDASESVSSSSTSPERRSKLKQKRNKKKLSIEAKKGKTSKSGHRKKRSSSSETSESSSEEYKAKSKHRKKKLNNSSSSEQKNASQSRSKKQKLKKKAKKKLRRKDDTSESSSEETSSSDYEPQKKLHGLKKKKKPKKVVTPRKKMKSKRSKVSHKGKKADSTVSVKKKRKKDNSSESVSSSGETESESSKEEQKAKKEVFNKVKCADVLRGR